MEKVLHFDNVGGSLVNGKKVRHFVNFGQVNFGLDPQFLSCHQPWEFWKCGTFDNFGGILLNGKKLRHFDNLGGIPVNGKKEWHFDNFGQVEESQISLDPDFRHAINPGRPGMQGLYLGVMDYGSGLWNLPVPFLFGR